MISIYGSWEKNISLINTSNLFSLRKENFKLPYKFLLFDLDHTLLDFDAAEDVALTQLLKEEGVVDIQAYKDYYVPMNKAL